MTTFRIHLLAIAIALTAFAFTACNRSHVSAANEDNSLPSREILSLDDQSFLINAEKSAIRKKTWAQEALDKSRNAAIVEFAKAAVAESDSSLSNLKRLMAAKGFAEPPALAEGTQLDAASRLTGLSDDALNDQFISLITAEQQAELRNFNSAAGTAADPDIRGFAGKNLAVLQQQLDKASQIEQTLATGTAR
jgi:putative membrane protein